MPVAIPLLRAAIAESRRRWLEPNCPNGSGRHGLGRPLLEFHTAGLIGSLIGALVVLAVAGASGSRRTLRS